MSTPTRLWFNIAGTWIRRGLPVTPPPVAPVISTFAPTSGLAGSTVTVTGSHFTGATAVRLGSSSATFTVVSDAQLTVTVPPGVTSGALTAVTPTGQATSTATFTVTTPPPPPGSTTVQRFLAPLVNGGSYWGFFPAGNNIATLRTFEAESNRQYDILKTYCYPDLVWVTSDPIRAAIDEGRIPHFSFAWRANGKNGGAYTTSPGSLLGAPKSSNANLGQPYNECFAYSQMYDGSADAWLDELARLWIANLGDLPVVLFDFNHEPEATRANATTAPSESAKIRMGCFSDPDWYFSTGGGSVYTDHKWDVCQEYVKAFAYLVDGLRRRGVKNLLSICTHASFSRANWQHQALYYPGCDGFGWDPYSGSTPQSRWSDGYNKLEAGIFLKWDAAVTKKVNNVSLAGQTLDAAAKSKPYFVQEWGILVRPDDATYAAYVSGAITALKSMPKIKASTLYSSSSTDIITGVPQTRAAFEAQSRDPYVNQSHPV